MDPRSPAPRLSPDCQPPAILGTAALTTAAMHGMAMETIAALIDRSDEHPAARLYDTGILQQLARQRENGLALLDAALRGSHFFRVRGQPAGAKTIRLLALVAPGDLMVNTPLDFITSHLDVQLDVLFLVPGCPLPRVIPEHDLMFVAISEADATGLARIRELCSVWPRPVLNDPAALPRLARDTLSQHLANVPGLCSPPTIRAKRVTLERACDRPSLMRQLLQGAPYPWLLRPLGSHAGAGLKKVQDAEGLSAALDESSGAEFFLSPFVDYRSLDGMFRKYRIAFIGTDPFLCHMAVSAHWMVHYLNAGMTTCEQKRQDEARAMAGFQRGFAARHAGAFAAIQRVLPFDVFSIDCAELPDGRLLVFEADTAAIIHAMDPVDLFPYKQMQMGGVFEAFRVFLHQKVAQRSFSREFAPAML